MLSVVLACPVAAEGPEPNRVAAAAVRPGPVAQRVLAQELHAEAMAKGDAILALAAARLALSVASNDPGRNPEVEEPPPAGEVPMPPGTTDILAAARALAGEDVTLAGLADEIAAEGGKPPPQAVSESRAALGPGQAALWSVSFFGDEVAEIAVLGAAPVTLSVSDDAGSAICAPVAPAEVVLCSFVPARNGTFGITVTNPGGDATGYALLTN